IITRISAALAVPASQRTMPTPSASARKRLESDFMKIPPGTALAWPCTMKGTIVACKGAGAQRSLEFPVIPDGPSPTDREYQGKSPPSRFRVRARRAPGNDEAHELTCRKSRRIG